MAFVFMILQAGNVFSAPRQATLTGVKGTVEVQKKGAKTWAKATEGMKVGEGDAVRTKAKSSVVIKWDSDTMVKLAAFTNFAITKSSADTGKENTTVSLFIGKTYSKVKKALKPGSSFEVSTPTAIAGVRSTYWVTEVSGDGSTLVGFLEGSGYLTAGGKTVDVPEGEKSKVTGDNPPEDPKPMTEEEKKEHKEESQELISATTEYEMKLLIGAPANNTETSDEKIKVSGTVTAGSKVSVAGVSASVDAEGKFSAEVELKMGENKLAVSATGPTGKTASVTVSVKRKKKEDGAPELTLKEPNDGTKTSSEKITVAGTAKNAKKASVNGEEVKLGDDGTFSTSVTLKSGENLISVSTSNDEGSTSVSVKAIYEPKEEEGAPSLTVTEPGDGANVSTSNVSVAGKAEGADSVKINGNETTVSPDGSFKGTVALNEGENTITVSASNDAGSTSQSFKVTYSAATGTTLPMVVVVQPADGSTVMESSVSVEGTAKDATNVTVNGVTAALGSDGSFKASVTLVEGANTVNIMASNSTGSASASVKVTYSPSLTDVVPPILAVTSPASNSTTNSPSTMVSGTTEDGAKVTVNGASVTVSGGVFSTPYTLTEGTNNIAVAATDAAGNKASQTVMVTLDSLPPMLTVTYPPDNYVSSVPSLSLTGITDANAKVTVGSTDVTADAGGNFTAMLVLTDGDNTITIKAVDKAGNVSSMTKKISYKSSPFYLTVSQPSDSSLTNQTSVAVLGFTDPTATVNVNGLQTTVLPSGSFQLDVALTVEGLNTITIQAKDSTGAILNVVKQVTRDTIPPMLTVSTPSPAFLTNNPVALVTGVSESGAAVTVNGASVSSGSFSQSVTLTEGNNTVSVVAKDKAGNATTVNVTGTLDSIAPILTVAEPSDGAQTFKNQVKLLGFTESGAVVKINGQQTTLSAGTTLDQCLNLTLGGNTFTITSTDKAGNVQTVVKQVMRTDIPPMIDPVPACQ